MLLHITAFGIPGISVSESSMSNDGASDLICPVMHGHSKWLLGIFSVESHKRWCLGASKRTGMRVWNKVLLSERTTRLRFQPIHHGSESTNTSLCIHAWTQGRPHSSCLWQPPRHRLQPRTASCAGKSKLLNYWWFRKASIWLRVKTASAASRIILTVHVHEQKYIDQNLVTINNGLCKIQPGQIINDQN